MSLIMFLAGSSLYLVSLKPEKTLAQLFFFFIAHPSPLSIFFMLQSAEFQLVLTQNTQQCPIFLKMPKMPKFPFINLAAINKKLILYLWLFLPLLEYKKRRLFIQK